MQGSKILLTCLMITLKLFLAESHSVINENPPTRRASLSRRDQALPEHRRIILERASKVETDLTSEAAIANSYTSFVPAPPENLSSSGQPAITQIPSPSAQPVMTQIPSSNAQSAITQAPSSTAPPAITQALSSCDRTKIKFEINRFLVSCEEELQSPVGEVTLYAAKLAKNNTAEASNLLAEKLTAIAGLLKAYNGRIQACGTDASPLSDNLGIVLSDVSWSAFQVVLTLKTMFEAVTSLYKQSPAFEKTCGPLLSNVSTALAALVAACSEQINLFDTRFFPLITPQLPEIQSIPGDFASFVGGFTS